MSLDKKIIEKIFPNIKDSDELLKYNIDYNSFCSLSLNKFDQTWEAEFFVDKENAIKKWQEKKLNYRFENNKHVFDIMPIEQVKNDKKQANFTYEYNSLFFRSDEFKKKHDGLHVVFSGCSNTEGVGMPLEFTWSYQLLEKIKASFPVSGYFNLGKAGSGWHKIINNFIQYVKNYGAPDYLFVLLPNILRDYYWNYDGGTWRENKNNDQFDPKKQWTYMQTLPSNYKGPNDHNHPLFTENSYYNAWPPFLTAWSLFNEYCKSINTKLIFSSWEKLDLKNIDNSKLFVEGFVKFSEIEKILETIDTNNIDNHSLFYEARDGHPGILQNIFWANDFFNFFQLFKNKGDST